MNALSSANWREDEPISSGRGVAGDDRRRLFGRLIGLGGRFSGGISRYIRGLFQADAARLALAGSLVRYGELHFKDGGDDDLQLAKGLVEQAVDIHRETANHSDAQRARALVARITSAMLGENGKQRRPLSEGQPSRQQRADPERDGLLALQKVLGRHLTSRARYDLLLFWSRCPGGWSGRSAVGPYTRLPRRQIDQALDELVVEAVVRRIDEKGGACYFALTEDPTLREAVLAFGLLTNSERHHLFQLCADGSKAVGPQSHGTPRRAGTRQAEPHG